MPSEPAIDVRGVSKRFGEQTALDDITLSAQEGEVVALLGPNGCGKSTLLRTLAGVVTPDGARSPYATATSSPRYRDCGATGRCEPPPSRSPRWD